MNLSDFARELKAKDSFIKASFGGFAGSGKSRTAVEFVIGTYKKLNCTKPILIIDNEKGSRFLIPHFKKAGIEVLLKETIELADVLASFKFLNSGEIDFLLIDSLTKIWYNYVNQYKTKNRRAFMTLQDWGKILPAWQEQFADKFVALEGNCVFTGRGGYTYDMEETEENGRVKKEFVKSGIKMKMAGETPFEPDLNIWMEIRQEMEDDKPKIWREALILKDRSDLIDGKTFINPTFKDFEPVLDYLISTPKGFVAGATNKENLSPAENYDWQNEKEQRDIQMELIKNLFVKVGLGGTAEAVKKQKVLIFEKFFGTSSQTAIEKIESFRLKQIRLELDQFFIQFIDAKDKIKYINEYKAEDIDISDFENALNNAEKGK